jgi:hypothetical protein
MKRLILSLTALVLMSSCDIMLIEPVYDHRDRVTGHYDIEEYSKTYHDYTYYSIYVSKDRYHSDVIYLENFYGADIRVEAYLDYDVITIPYQVINGYEIDGDGTLTGSHLSLNYRVKDLYNHSITDYCDTWGDRDY